MESKIVNGIYETTNYEMFKYLKGNRTVKYSKKLELAAKEVGFLYQILVNEKMEIIDGQHRLEVCKKLGLPVRYEIKKGAGDNEVESLNTTAANWTLKNYIEHYSLLGNEEYQKLGKILDKKVSGDSAVIATAMNFKRGSGGSNNIVKEGNFKFCDYERYIEFVEYVERLKSITKIKMGERLFPALYALYTLESFDGERLIKKMFETNQIERIGMLNDYSKIIETLVIEINNHHLGSGSKNYINYTFSSDGKKELIITSDLKVWAKTTRRLSNLKEEE